VDLNGKVIEKADPVMAVVETVINPFFKYLRHRIRKRLIDATEEKVGEVAWF
jgi:hypothetical protein